MITLYRTFALYEEKLEFNVLHGRVPEYTTGDVKIAAVIDGVSSSTIPGKDDGYVVESINCDNGADALWDSDTWRISIGNLTKTKTTCTIAFKTIPTVADYVKSLFNWEDVLDGIAKVDYDVVLCDGCNTENLRYIGSNPSNYVLFNNELWRIIGNIEGVVDSDGNKDAHVKIIRNESIGNYAWSGSSSIRNNDWTKSTLNTDILNGTYYNSLTNEAKNMISNVVWGLGAANDYPILKTSDYYYAERGNIVYEGHATTWTGKVGMIYISDYGYSSLRDCYSDSNDKISNACHTEGWLYSGVDEWTLTVMGNDIDGWDSYAGCLSTDHQIISQITNYEYAVRPAVYLNNNVGIIGGSGTEQDPYILKSI